jgi:Nucleotidyl transferase AbiEii toxin, Type IV TA system
VSKLKNVAASIRQRLLNRAREDKRPFNELLQYYAMERFLYRLAQSAHARQFILKGALMLRVWEAADNRPTMDIDMLGLTSNDIERILEQIRDILEIKVEDDGLLFDKDSLEAETITEDADYQGVRVRDWWKDGQTLLQVKSAVEQVLDKDLPKTYDRIVFKEKCDNVIDLIIDFAANGRKWVA